MRPGSLALLLVFLPGLTLACDNEFEFGRNNHVFDQYADNSVVKIHSATDYRGAGTLIDVENGFILTACHVVKNGKTLTVSFNGNDHATPLKADIVASSIPENCKPDIALLRISESLPSFASAVDVSFQTPQRKNQHNILMVSAEEPAAEPTAGRLAKQGTCRYTIRKNTYLGDSGSPVFSEVGLLIGIVQSASHSGLHSDRARGKAHILPLFCTADNLFAPRDIADATKTWAMLVNTDLNNLKLSLKPGNRHKLQWISNLRFAHAIHRAAKSGSDLVPDLERLNCPLTPATTERRLGSAFLTSLYTASLPSLVARRKADEAQREASLINPAIAPEKRIALLQKSAALHAAYLNLSNIDIMSIASSPWNGFPILPDDADSATITQSIKALADINIKIAEMSGETDRNKSAFAFGLLASQLSPEDPKLQSQALSAAGIAAARISQSGEEQISWDNELKLSEQTVDWEELSIQSFNEAAKKEALAGWATRSYNDIWAKRKAGVSGSDFPEAGNYVPFSASQNLFSADGNSAFTGGIITRGLQESLSQPDV